MTNLKCLSSGSKGNCYLLEADNGEVLIIDAGIPIMDIKRGLNWNVKCVVGAVVTHRHTDHSKSLEDLRHMGIKVVAPYESGNVKSMRFSFGSFNIQAFDVPHNGCWNNGFLIKTPDGQKILYMTDLEYCPYSFRKQSVDHMLIECNYMKSMVDMDAPNYVHKVRGHCELETTKGIIKENETNSLVNVILCHLGRDTCEEDKVVEEVKKIVPRANVDVAKNGKEWILRKGGECPF
jgi:phosphoribosyl 1,2-cyclic phosphodiesterase